MNATELLARFDHLADASDAIPRLRRFILDLAVRGKLVEQDPNDEPASELLKHIKAKLLASREGERQRSSNLPSISESEAPFEIPCGWAWERLGNIGETNIGLTYSPQDVADCGIPVLRSGNIRDGKLDLTELVRVAHKPKPSVMIQDGDLLICARNGSRALVGKVALVEHLTEPTAFGAFMAKFQSDANRYLCYFISSPLFREVINEVNTTTINQLTQNNLRSTLVPIPPLAEQHRIVAKVDELMALCDRLEAAQAEREDRRDRLIRASLHRLNQPADTQSFRAHARFALDNLPRLSTRPEHVPQLRQSILNLAVRGRLVPQDAKDEPVSDLLRRFQAARERLFKDGRIRKQIEVSKLATNEEPFDLPTGWQWVRFGEIIYDSDAGWSPRTESFPRSGDFWGVVKVSAVTWDKFLPEENKQLLPGVTPPAGMQIRRGDFLISRANTSALIAKCVVVENEPTKLVLSDKIVRLDVAAECNRTFLRIVNNHAEHARSYYAQEASGTSLSMKNVSRPAIYGLAIPLPPLAEQNRIVAKADELMTLCDRLEAQLTTTQTESRRLLEAVLHEALSPTTHAKAAK
jgi:type I restriction enzyme S subunit